MNSPGARNGSAIPTYSRLAARPTCNLPAALRGFESDPAFRERDTAHQNRLLAPGLRPSEDSQIFITLGATQTSTVTITWPNGGKGLAVFSTLLRAMDYGNVHLFRERLVIMAHTPRGMLGLLQGAANAGVNNAVLDRCPRCSIFTAVEIASLTDPDKIITWWAISRSLQQTRADRFLEFAAAAVDAGDLETARDVGLEGVGHVSAEDPRIHVLLGTIGIRTGDTTLVNEARAFLRFLKCDDQERALGLAADASSSSSLSWVQHIWNKASALIGHRRPRE